MIASANENDARKFVPFMKKISIKTGARSRSRPEEVYADKQYDLFFARAYLTYHKIKARIDRRSREKKTGRPAVFDEDEYKRNRSCAERFFGWLKDGIRRLAIRYELLVTTYLGFSHLAAFIMHWRVLGSVESKGVVFGC